MNDQSDGEGLLLSWTNTQSRYTAVLDESDGMAWLYLTNASRTGDGLTCPAFMTKEPPDNVDVVALMANGQPPPLYKAIASDSAVIVAPRAADFSVVWGANGAAVLLRYRGSPICMILQSSRLGFSRAVRKRDPLIAEPFNDPLAGTIFGSTH